MSWNVNNETLRQKLCNARRANHREFGSSDFLSGGTRAETEIVRDGRACYVVAESFGFSRLRQKARPRRRSREHATCMKKPVRRSRVKTCLREPARIDWLCRSTRPDSHDALFDRCRWCNCFWETRNIPKNTAVISNIYKITLLFCEKTARYYHCPFDAA